MDLPKLKNHWNYPIGSDRIIVWLFNLSWSICLERTRYTLQRPLKPFTVNINKQRRKLASNWNRIWVATSIHRGNFATKVGHQCCYSGTLVCYSGTPVLPPASTTETITSCKETHEISQWGADTVFGGKMHLCNNISQSQHLFITIYTTLRNWDEDKGFIWDEYSTVDSNLNWDKLRKTYKWVWGWNGWISLCGRRYKVPYGDNN